MTFDQVVGAIITVSVLALLTYALVGIVQSALESFQRNH